MDTPQALLDTLHGIGLHSLANTNIDPDSAVPIVLIHTRFCTAKDKLKESQEAIKTMYESLTVEQREQKHLDLAPYNVVERLYQQVEEGLEAVVSGKEKELPKVCKELPCILLHMPGKWEVATPKDALKYFTQQQESAQARLDAAIHTERSFPSWLIGVLAVAFCCVALLLWKTNHPGGDLLSISFYLAASIIGIILAFNYYQKRRTKFQEAEADIKRWKAEIERVKAYL